MSEIVRLIARHVRTEPLGPDRWEWWQVELDGSILLPRAKIPFFQGCRALLAIGIDPDTMVTMRLANSANDSFVPMRLGDAAKRTISESRDGPPIRVVSWQERPNALQRRGEIPASGLSQVSGGPDGPDAASDGTGRGGDAGMKTRRDPGCSGATAAGAARRGVSCPGESRQGKAGETGEVG